MATLGEQLEQVIEELVAHELVRAAAVLDESGKIERLRGHAKVFRNGAPPEEGELPEGEESRHEDVFIESVGDRYLVVVFEAREDFEPIKERVDELLEEIDA